MSARLLAVAVSLITVLAGDKRMIGFSVERFERLYES